MPSSTLPNLGSDRFAPLDRYEIDFGQRHDAAIDAEQIDDGEMLARLRHDAIVGGNDQQDKVDAARAGQHVVDELFMAGNVDETQYRRAFGVGR